MLALARTQNLSSTPSRVLHAVPAVSSSVVDSFRAEERACVHGLESRESCESCELDDFLFFRDDRGSKELARAVSARKQAPDFTLTSSSGETVTLNKLVGTKNLVLFFYPLDGLPGCTTEACAFRDAYGDFKKADSEVIGISTAEPYQHHFFARKNNLPMPLLSDVGGRVRRLYDVKPTWGVLPGRETFVVDKQGDLHSVFRSQVQIRRHIEESLSFVRSL